jgi:hypothetical protein
MFHSHIRNPIRKIFHPEKSPSEKISAQPQEKAMFEWNTFEGIDHSRAAVRAMQHFADFFVEEARQNAQVWDLVVRVNNENHSIAYYSCKPVAFWP